MYDAGLDDLASVAAIRSELTWLLRDSDAAGQNVSRLKLRGTGLERLHGQLDTILNRRDIFLNYSKRSVSETPLDSAALRGQLSHIAECLEKGLAPPAETGLDAHMPTTLLEFPSVEEFQSISLAWMTIIAAHLIQCDIISSMQSVQGVMSMSGDLPNSGELERRLLQHRASLRLYSRSVLKAIPYITRPEIMDTSPFFLGAVFTLARVVFVRECEKLETERDKRDSDLRSCTAARDALEKFLDWVSLKKINIKLDWGGLDFDPPSAPGQKV